MTTSLALQDGIRVQRHPSRNFIRYLLTLGEGAQFDAEFVNRNLSNFGLFRADPESIDEEAAELRTMKNRPIPFLPSRLKNSEVQLYLKSVGVLEMHQRTPEVEAATRLLGLPQLREDVETGLLGNLANPEIAHALDVRYGIKEGEDHIVDPEAIKAYAHYYFNPNAMTLSEWSFWLQEEDQTRKAAVVRGGQELALHRLGMQPSIEGVSMLRHMSTSLFFRFMEVDQRPTDPVTIKMLTDLSKEFRGTFDVMKDAGEDLAAVMDRFGKFAMRQDDSAEVPSIEDLGGTHSHQAS